MAFVARCTFCHLILREVPEHRLGSSVDCPRCGNSFTLAEANDPGALAAAQAPRAGPPEPSAAVAVAPQPAAPTQTALAEVRAEAEAAVRERPAPEEPPAAVPRRPVRRFTNYPGLASFLLGCFAFLAGAVLHAGLATLALGLLGLLLGALGLCFSFLVPSRRILPAAGLAVSLPALLIPAFVPEWLELDRLGARPRHANRGDAAMSLSGAGGLRRSTEREAPWVDASRDALHHGDVRLRVSSAVVKTPEFEPLQGRTPPPDRCLVVGLRITNADVMRKVGYTGWAGGNPAPEPPVLRDEQGKTYAPKVFADGWVVKGRAPSATIPPGKTHDDVLVFEAPPRGVSNLRLELPASAVGADGRMRMEIPKQMIIFR
jgi:hypothetical protein